MKETKKFLVVSLLAVLACGVLEAAPKKMYGLGKPAVIVADEPDAYFKDAANPATAAGLEQYADSFVAGGKVTHVFWRLSSEARGKFAAAGVEPYKTLVARTQAKGAEAWISIRVSEILGEKPEIWKPDARNELTKAIVALLKECPAADGYELDFQSGITGLSAVAPNGEKPFNLYDAARYYASLRSRFIEGTRNRDVQIALRVPADDAAVEAMGFRHGEGGVGATLILPCLTSGQVKAREFCCADWRELDRVGPRVLPGVPVESLTAEELAGWVSSMRGWGFPGVVFLHVGSAAKEMREAICVKGLADCNKTAAGVRKLVLGGACDGTYEFALQQGSVVEKPVQVKVRFGGKEPTADKVLLNGRRPQSSAKDGAAVTYAFAPEAVIDRRNYLRLPVLAEGSVEIVLTAAADAVKAPVVTAPAAKPAEPPKPAPAAKPATQPKTQKEVEDWLMQTNELAKLSKNADGSLPDVFVMGDSISLGYTPVVQKMMAGKANVTRPPTNCGSSYHYLVPKAPGGKRPMEEWVGDRHYRVITVNFGIWDNHYNVKVRPNAKPEAVLATKRSVNLWSIKNATKQLQDKGEEVNPVTVSRMSRPQYEIRTPINEYEANLRTILGFLKEHADKVVFCLTTPVPEWLACDGFGRVRVYNEMAAAVCAEMGVDVVDLYSVAEQHADTYRSDGVHFKPEGYQLLANEVVKGIVKAMK